ncbi:pseudouridine synthase [Fundicoccus culcitae]|uniref:Pseudouridine synthase n=1 Tax=Fundicoccus culcitae TaxID=2969821 RepID=A0ABY5P6L9_9LACT|nr:pseudouridine synthase [Fundicoccus culcitae]UUX34389.1 rRNA pseudouridine synthase [Fundicoccus culcitae]
MRIDRFLANEGLGSRKEVKQLIKAGLVKINHQLVESPNQQLSVETDEVSVNDHIIAYQPYVYIMLNKPQDVVSATQDKLHPTVIDCLDGSYGHLELFPVGRLDIDTTGLLLLTNDGKLAHQLLAPKNKVPKTYAATIKGQVNEQDKLAFEHGLDLGDFVTQPANLQILAFDEVTNHTLIQTTIIEGKFHQVKRMFQKVGKEVIQLKRISMGSLVLDERLAESEWRELSPSELQHLMQDM